jgi:cysteine dioxygenase
MPFTKLIEVAEAVAQGKSTRNDLVECMRQFAAAKLPLDEFISWSKEGYTRNQLYKSENLELVLTCWEDKQDSAPHDHGGSWGMVVPYDGQIYNRMFVVAEGNQVKEIAPILQQTGEVLVIEASDIHQVACACEKRNYGPHVSLHVYFPPISVMNKYVPQVGNAQVVNASAYETSVG